MILAIFLLFNFTIIIKAYSLQSSQSHDQSDQKIINMVENIKNAEITKITKARVGFDLREFTFMRRTNNKQFTKLYKVLIN